MLLLKHWGRRSPPLRGAWGQLRWYASSAGRSQLARGLKYAGRRRTCPYCGWQGRLFHPTLEHPRGDAQCPRCYAKERHRALYFYLEQLRRSFGHRARVLEIAPEPHSLRYWKNQSNTEYISLDLYSPLAGVRGDMLALPLPDRAFDLIICMHVLEHIPDDRGAMRELRRVLHETGQLLIQVPIDREVTFEDPSVTDPLERERLFGQTDHVRAYGSDLIKRLQAADLIVSEADLTRDLSTSQMRRAGVVPGETIIVCTSPTAPNV